MAFSLNGNGKGHETPMAEINVTPFVDVVLVLLIIFMITAGVFDFGLQIDVPQTREVTASQQEFPFVNITSDGKVYFNTEPVAPGDIPARVSSDAEEKATMGDARGVYIRSDKAVPWEIIAPILQICSANGIQVHMVTKPMERATP